MSKIIWTNHARERNKQRDISEDYIHKTINNYDQNINSGDNKYTFKKRFNHQTVTVITKYTEHGEYLILSAWIDPPNFGTMDYKKNKNYRDMKKAGIIKKIWITLRSQMGF